MSQEDDLRALAKIMDFLRAVSIILVVMNVYWFCYEAIRMWGVNIGVVDKILLNFDRTAGLFHRIFHSKMQFGVELALLRTPPPLQGGREEQVASYRDEKRDDALTVPLRLMQYICC